MSTSDCIALTTVSIILANVLANISSKGDGKFLSWCDTGFDTKHSVNAISSCAD